MQVYISIDMEGVAGIATFDQVARGGHGYRAAMKLMTGEANAAIAGAFDAGADSVVVNDSHGTMDNLLHEELDPRARVVFGSPKLDCMAEGISEDHDVALFLGYHAAAGGPGVLAHTYSSHFTQIRLNGRPVSEAEVNALQAAAVGVPVGLVTGDDIICAAVRERLPKVHTVEVKTAHGVYAADSLSPTVARERIRTAAAEAVASAGSLLPVDLPDELHLEIDMPNAAAAELGGLIPTVTHTTDRTLTGHFSTPRELLGVIVVAAELAAGTTRTRANLISR
ncbi:M55 family metallopeptidase [Sinosporangium siamense]|uniref:Transporter n=1 Tax=Sinosporangium siamense TaxID=1367973 RepID=A0A919RJM1_9ACTN|nr:M55 family metallopeptidase [Sinosporangium siamense]GII95008.1 transporter [Sinosporangium siamense]